MKRILLAAVLALAAASAYAADPDFTSMLRELDELNGFQGQDFSALYTIVSEKPGESPSTLQVKIFRRDERDQFLILFVKPERQKGQGYLKIDDDVWFYDPESGNYTHSTMRESIQGSEAKNKDLSRLSYAEDYDISSSESGKLGKYEAWILTLKAKNDEVPYPVVKIWIRKDRVILLKTEDYGLSGRLMRTTLYPPKYIQVGAKLIPSQVLIQDELNPGEKSQLTLSEVSVGSLPDSVFTKAFLQSAR